MLYSLKVRFLKTRRGNLLWRYLRAWRGDTVGDYRHLPIFIRRYSPNRSFADIGCMWGVNGEYSFIAEEAGASEIKAVDVFGPTPEFEKRRREKKSRVEFILGDATQPATIARVGAADVVFCAGVLYHHPSPFDLLTALRRMCRRTLILRTSTIPEHRRLRHAAVYFPMLDEEERKLWNLSSLGVPHQAGISTEFIPEEGYGKWFWGITPSCLRAMLRTAGFRIELSANEAFAQTVICSPDDSPFLHRLPDEEDAKKIGQEISLSGKARPA
jgi:hypothetical protein